MQASTTATSVGRSGIREIVNLALHADSDIARLEIGEPGFPTPPHIVEAGVEAARAGGGYTQSSGTLELRSTIVESMAARYALELTPNDVVVCQGAGQGISAVFSAIISPGDEVLVPDPSWPNYAMLTRLHSGVVVPYPLPAERGFIPDIDQIAELIGPRTRAIVLNSPGNPTGATLPRELVLAIAELAASRGVIVVSDEVYDQLVFEGEPSNAFGFGLPNVVSVFSFSKTYAMTGWRVGYVVAPHWLSELLGHIQEPLLSCISTVSQAAAVAALRGPQGVVSDMRSEYRVRRELAVSLLADGGLKTVRPSGAFYVMAPLAPDADSRAAAIELVDWGVSVAPGTAFGRVAADHVRLSLASDADTLQRGISRFLGWYSARDGGNAVSIPHERKALS